MPQAHQAFHPSAVGDLVLASVAAKKFFVRWRIGQSIYLSAHGVSVVEKLALVISDVGKSGKWNLTL
jgi:hypothetical protein